jgi:hypothetical protein
MKPLSPRQAIRAHCQECLGMSQFNRSEVEVCQGDTCFTGPCPLYPNRLGKRISVKVFRRFCIHCQGGQSNFIAECLSTDCKIFPYRSGKNPSLVGIGRKANKAGMEALSKYVRNRRVNGNLRQESMLKGQGTLHDG